MVRVKDIYVSIDQIRSIKFEEKYLANNISCYLVINYVYDNNPIKIEVENFTEFVDLADYVCNQINFMRTN